MLTRTQPPGRWATWEIKFGDHPYRAATMNAAGRKWYSFMVDLAIRLRVWRPGSEEIGERSRRMSFETNVARLPIRITEFLRDRLRFRWMRVKK